MRSEVGPRSTATGRLFASAAGLGVLLAAALGACTEAGGDDDPAGTATTASQDGGALVDGARAPADGVTPATDADADAGSATADAALADSARLARTRLGSFEAGRDHGDADLVAHRRVDHGAEDDVGARVGLLDGDVVDERDRLGADADDVVDVHRHAVDADGVDAAGLLGHRDLRGLDLVLGTRPAVSAGHGVSA